jgi:hypothetical protein
MSSIEIPEPELRIETQVRYPSFNSTYDVVFVLVFGGVEIVRRHYAVPVYDHDNIELEACRYKFRTFVADRLATLFEEPPVGEGE